MNILVTGGAGYLGSVIVPVLLEQNYCVTVVDNLMFRQSSLLACCSNKNFSFIKGDCRDERLMIDLLKQSDILIPLAALVGAPLCEKNPLDTYSINHDAVLMLNRFLSADQMMLIPITNSGYGIGEKEGLCTENSPLNPISLYGRAKVELEKKLLSSGNVVSFRLANCVWCISQNEN